MKTDVPLYFFILGLTPLLGVSHSFIHGAVMAGVLLGLLLIQGPLLSGVGYRLPDSLRLPALFFFNLVLVTSADLGIAAAWPVLHPGFGIYLKLMAVNPLILKILGDQARGWDLKEALEYALRTSGGFLLTAAVLSFFREVLGAGRLTYGLEGEILSIPLLAQTPLKVLFAGGSGALILAGLFKAFQNWGYSRGWLWFRQEEPQGPRHPKEQKPSGQEGPENRAAPESPAVISVRKSERPLPEVPADTAARISEPEPAHEPAQEMNPAPAAPPEPVSQTPDGAEAEPAAPEVSEVAPADSVTPEWGETPARALLALGLAKDFEKKRILVIGCGSGEEVYRQAMVLADARRGNPRFSFRIRGVEAFAARVDMAKEGTYREVQLEGVSLDQKQRYLLQNREEGPRLVRIGQELRQYTEFVVSEYLGQGYFFQKPCDLVAVQQDMDFFTPEERQTFLVRVTEHLTDSGTLVLPENWPRETVPSGLKRTGSRVYRKEN